MRSATILFCTVLALAGCRQKEIKPKADWSSIPACKIVFGKDSNNFVIIRRAESELLVHRDGNPASTPESYPMPKNRLDQQTEIAPFKVGNVEYKMTNCTAYVDTKPKKHGLMIFVDIVEGTRSYSQYCDVELKSNFEEVSIAHFDGPLTIGPQTINYVPDKLELKIGGKPTDFRVHLGTLDKPAGCWTVVSVHKGEECRFADAERPVLRIDFLTATGKKLSRSYTLDEFC